MILFSPAGGPRYRRRQDARMATHRAYVAEHGLAAVVELAQRSAATFSEDPRVGLWGSVKPGAFFLSRRRIRTRKPWAKMQSVI